MKDTNRTTNRRTNNDAMARMHAKDYCRTKGGIALVIDFSIPPIIQNDAFASSESVFLYFTSQ